MATDYFLLPVINSTFQALKGPDWYFDENTYISKISDQDYGAIHRDAPEYVKSLIKSDNWCIFHKYENEDISDETRSIAEGINFSLNLFRAEQPLVLAVVLFFTKARKTRFVRAEELNLTTNIFAKKTASFKFKAKTSREKVSAFYKILSEALNQNPGLLIALERHNWSLSRVKFSDRVIDLAISLESLVPGGTELS